MRARGDNRRFRLLVIANETVCGEALLSEIRKRCRDRDCEILVVTPALVGSRAAHWASDVDEAVELPVSGWSSRSSARASACGRGQIGDPDPRVAIEYALGVFPADEIIVSTHPPERSHWLKEGVVERARNEIDLPVTHVVVTLTATRRHAS